MKSAQAFTHLGFELVAEAGFLTDSLSLQEQDADHEAGYPSHSPAEGTSAQSEPADAADTARQGPVPSQPSLQRHKSAGVVGLARSQALPHCGGCMELRRDALSCGTEA